MKIPKSILHPSLLLAGGGLLLFLLWQNTPTPTQIDTVLQKPSATTNVPLPPRDTLAEILDVQADGQLALSDGFVRLRDNRFQNLNEAQRQKVHAFFVGKLISKNGGTERDLPIALYDKVCFSLPDDQRKGQACPLLLQP